MSRYRKSLWLIILLLSIAVGRAKCKTYEKTPDLHGRTDPDPGVAHLYLNIAGASFALTAEISGCIICLEIRAA